LREKSGESPTLAGAVSFLSREQRLVLAFIVLLLLTGWAVKAYRAAHPPPAAARPAPVSAQ